MVTIFSGCGPSGTYSKIGSSDSNNTSSENVTITVERGPVFMATVTDIEGKKAINDNSGFSNRYQFESKPTYPITVKGGYIDINRNGKIDNNDSKLNITMSSYSTVVSPLTTFIGNNQEMIDTLNRYYKITEAEITQQVPSKSSINAILLSNILYKALLKGFKIDSEEFNQTVDDIQNIYEENFEEITDLSELSSLLEKKVLEDLNIKQLDSQEINELENNLSINNSAINSLPIDDSSSNTTESNNSSSSTSDTTASNNSSSSTSDTTASNNNSSANNNSFSRTYNSGENIQTIWNLTLNIPKDINIKNIDIGMHIVKERSGTIGNILIRGVSIKDNRVVNIDSIDVFGEKVSGTTGSISYGKSHNITQASVVLLQDKFLLIKLGYIMEQQTIVSKESFRKADNYDCTLYVSQLDINGLSSNGDNPLKLSFDTFYTFPENSQKINGLVRITE